MNTIAVRSPGSRPDPNLPQPQLSPQPPGSRSSSTTITPIVPVEPADETNPYLTFISGIQTEVRDIFSEIDSPPLPNPPVVRRNSELFLAYVEFDYSNLATQTRLATHTQKITFLFACINTAVGLGLLTRMDCIIPDMPQAACEGPQAAGFFKHNVILNTALNDHAKLNAANTIIGMILVFPLFGLLLLGYCSAALPAHISNSNTIKFANALMGFLGMIVPGFGVTVYSLAPMLPRRSTTVFSLSEFGRFILTTRTDNTSENGNCFVNGSHYYGSEITELRTQLLNCRSLLSEREFVIYNISLHYDVILTSCIVAFFYLFAFTIMKIYRYYHPAPHYNIAPIADRIAGVSRDLNAIPSDYRELKIAVMDHIISEWRQLSHCQTIAPDVTQSLNKLIRRLENCNGNDGDTKFTEFKQELICQISYEYPILAVILVNRSGFLDVAKPNIVDIEYMIRYVTHEYSNSRASALPPTEGSIIAGTAIKSRNRFNLGDGDGVYKFVPIHRELALLSIVDRLLPED